MRITATLTLAALAAAPAWPETKTVVLGPQYGASGFHQAFLGRDYRQLWTMPVVVEVLDLKGTDGGLKATRRVGGQQTMGLAFESASGRRWTFRSADKDPSAILPPDLQDSIARSIVQDQIAANHPASPLVADALMDAAGVIHPSVKLVVMPDDPALGEFQKDFAGVVGTFEEYPNEGEDGRPGFQGALEIIGHEKFYERVQMAPDARADSRALLNARLLDVFMGDWDRHRKQWRWAKFADRPLWQPLPEDRDQAFARFEGLILKVARNAQPRFVNLGPTYPGIFGITFNGWEQDRQLLADLTAPAWDEAAKALQGKLTDSVIDGAVARMPAEYQKVDAARMARDLKSRRDRLPQMARDYYRFLAERVDVHATDQDETVQVAHAPDRSLTVRVSASGAPYYERTFLPGETEEVRVYLKGGDDKVVATGDGSITVRVIGGDGADSVDDSASGHLRFSDTAGKVVKGSGTHVDERPYSPPPPNPKAPWIPPRDWGHNWLVAPWIGYGPDEGVFTGMALTRVGYGFRKDPYASRQEFRAGWAFGAKTFRIDYSGEFLTSNRTQRYGVDALASGIETLRFYGFGNDTAEQGEDVFHRVNQDQYLVAPHIGWGLGRVTRFQLGPVVKYSTTDLDSDRFVGQIRPPLYGTEDFGQVGATASLRVDTRNRPRVATRGALLDVTGTVYPEVWSVRETFGSVQGSLAAYLTGGGYLQPSLALRAGGKHVFGDYPFHEAAYIGGALSTNEGLTVRGFRQNRFAGDSSLYGNAELRIFLGRVKVLLPADFGIFGLADIGRVYLDGESSDAWHQGYGGGIWLAFLDRKYAVSVAVAQSDERTGVYVRGGFGF